MGLSDIVGSLSEKLGGTGFDDDRALKRSVKRVKGEFPEGDPGRVISEEAKRFEDDVEQLAGYVFYDFFSSGAFHLKMGDRNYVKRDVDRHMPLQNLNMVENFAIPNVFSGFAEDIFKESESQGMWDESGSRSNEKSNEFLEAEKDFECALEVAEETPLPQKYVNLANKELERIEKRREVVKEILDLCRQVDSVNDSREKRYRLKELVDEVEIVEGPDMSHSVGSPGSGAYRPDWKVKDNSKNEELMSEIKSIREERRKIVEEKNISKKLKELCQKFEDLCSPKSVEKDLEVIEKYKIEL